MSAKQRQEAEALRAKYARVFDISIEDVRVDLEGEEDACAYGPDDTFPVWTLGSWSVDTSRGSAPVTAAISEAVRSGAQLSVMRDGKVTMQVAARRKAMPACTFDEPLDNSMKTDPVLEAGLELVDAATALLKELRYARETSTVQLEIKLRDAVTRYERELRG